MAYGDDRLRSLWTNRKRQPSHRKIDEMTLAAWIDADCPEDETMETLLADDPEARELLSAIQLEADDEVASASPQLLDALRCSIAAHLLDACKPPASRSIIGSIGLTTAAAAAAIIVAALGFTFGQTAAPATNEATNNFIAAVTFDLLEADSSDLESIILATGLNVSESREGEEQ